MARPIAPMIEITEAKGGVIVMIPVHVQLLNLVKHVLPQLDILAGRPASLILVSRDICSEGLQVRQTVSCHHNLSSFPFNQLDALVIIPWTHFPPVPSEIESHLPTARMSSYTHITDQTIFQSSLETVGWGWEHDCGDSQEGECGGEHYQGIYLEFIDKIRLEEMEGNAIESQKISHGR